MMTTSTLIYIIPLRSLDFVPRPHHQRSTRRNHFSRHLTSSISTDHYFIHDTPSRARTVSSPSFTSSASPAVSFQSSAICHQTVQFGAGCLCPYEWDWWSAELHRVQPQLVYERDTDNKSVHHLQDALISIWKGVQKGMGGGRSHWVAGNHRRFGGRLVDNVDVFITLNVCQVIDYRGVPTLHVQHTPLSIYIYICITRSKIITYLPTQIDII